jgi:7,8-dihydroneopterin aldolase/epimerase/oxygenase
MPKLSKLFIKNLVFSGVHGATGREVTDEQHFQVDIEMQIDISKAVSSDQLEDTYDYKHAKEIARTVIENEHYVLIETICFQIAKRICDDPKVFFADVLVTKLHASQNGLPGVSVSYKRAPQEMV